MACQNENYSWEITARKLLESPMFMSKKCHPKKIHSCEREYDIKDIDSTFIAKYN